jgi:hypothetical protein
VTSAGGQATAEYAGLLGIAAVLGAVLALIVGPALVGAVRSSLRTALSGGPESSTAVVASAADIADVQSALHPGGEELTPDSALLALSRRHGPAQVEEITSALLLAAAREASPSLGATRTYRPVSPNDGIYAAMPGTAAGDRDVERAIGPLVVTWVTVEGQRRALAAALAHHAKPISMAIDAVGVIPFAKLPITAAAAGTRALLRAALDDLPKDVEWLHRASSVVELTRFDDGGIPPGMRVGDLIVAWPVQRTFWRGGRSDRKPAVDYEHRIVLRPGARGLRVVAEEIGT